MRRLHAFLAFPVLALVALPAACGGSDDNAGPNSNDAGSTPDAGSPVEASAQDTSAPATTFRVSGIATYDWVPANDDVTEGGVMLDYAKKSARPIRRATVQAMENGASLVQTTTDDSGAFNLDVPLGHTITIRVSAEAVATTNVADNIKPDNCVGASWDVKVVDNTKANAEYTLDDPTTHAVAAAGVALSAPMVYTNNAYVTRTAAPFAILDTIVTEMELVCQGKASVSLPSLLVMWSINNVPSGTDATTGEIGTSHYIRDPDSMQSELVILGKEDVDTDEYDDHVIAHEYGHYLEDRLFRSDSPGGTHQEGDVLDPRVAFGEGWGNALSGMTFNDPIYVDTSGVGQAQGLTLPVNVAPTDDDRGLYSEVSVQYMLWSLFDNRHPGAGTIDRIYNVFANFQTTTPGLTSALTFAGYYNQVYGGAAESLQSLWGTALATPYNALCKGPCTGTGDTADPFDTDDDIGIAYAGTRHYPETTGALEATDFWRVSKLLVDGTNGPTPHDTTDFGGYSESGNKYGAQRQYRYISATAQSTTITVGNLGAASCSSDVLDMQITLAGKSVAFDQETTGVTAGCPTATFDAQPNAVYNVVINGQDTALPSYAVVVSHKQSAPFTVSAAMPAVADETDLAIPIVVTPMRDVADLRVNVRGIDGVTVGNAARQSAFLSHRVPVVTPATVRLARGASGFVVVDVSGTVKGRHVGSSYLLPLRSKSAVLAPRTIGTLLMDTNGKHIVSMKALVQ